MERWRVHRPHGERIWRGVVAAAARVSGCHIAVAGLDWNGPQELDVLPTRCGLVTKCCAGKQSAVVGPQVADMRTGVACILIEAQAIDVAVGVGREAESDFDW